MKGSRYQIVIVLPQEKSGVIIRMWAMKILLYWIYSFFIPGYN